MNGRAKQSDDSINIQCSQSRLKVKFHSHHLRTLARSVMDRDQENLMSLQPDFGSEIFRYRSFISLPCHKGPHAHVQVLSIPLVFLS